jgi:two-component system cell cycle response regulator
MEEETKILVATPKTPPAPTSASACLVHIYPPSTVMGSRYSLDGKPLVLGRDNECDIQIDDESVSRRHVCLQSGPDGYTVLDLKSTNGTYVNDSQVKLASLKDGDYLRVGNAIYRFLGGGNVEAAYHEEIYRLTIIDALTEIHNRRYLLEFLGRALSCALRYRRPLSVLMFDIDGFKGLNDQFGHLVGDCTLRQLASLVRNAIRKEDLLARFGGDEFVIVLPETPKEGALTLAEKLRELVTSTPFSFESLAYSVTISVGVTSINGEEWLTTSELIDHADPGPVPGQEPRPQSGHRLILPGCWAALPLFGASNPAPVGGFQRPLPA